MPDPRPSRRALLKGTAMTGAAAALLAMPAAALQPDPVFAAIAAHGSAHKRIMAMDSTDAGFDALMDEEDGLWKAFCACRPTTPEGLAAYAAHAAAYPDLDVLPGSCGLSHVITNIAEALRTLGVGGAHV
ncbi:twin-arginine translocation signal domain-containing protein [Xanthobacter sp. KR7-65]|uniref:twin-arginine translocation signal domain-containing protein n=1 Tax=Xanthobacter sp. KR7-65 TaxID=3156612 RepID=UPI0032B52E92